MQKHWVRFVFLALCLGTQVHAEEEQSSSREFLFPLAPYLADVVGMVFPAAPVAPDINAATLPYAGKGNYLEFANAPSINGTNPYAVNATFTHTGKTFGFGGGYLGQVGATTNHGFFGGFGFSIGALALGASARMKPEAGAGYEVDVSMVIPMQKKLRFSALINDVLTQRKIQVGVGFQDETYYFEIDVVLPPLSNLTAGYTFKGATSFYIGKTTVYGAAGYDTGTAAITYTGGLGYRFLNKTSMLAQYSSNMRAALGLVLPL